MIEIVPLSKLRNLPTFLHKWFAYQSFLSLWIFRENSKPVEKPLIWPFSVAKQLSTPGHGSMAEPSSSTEKARRGGMTEAATDPIPASG
jgi:hypothetical protein